MSPRSANLVRSLAVCAVIAGLSAGAYWRVVTYPFVNWDDPSHVYLNPSVATGLSWENFKWSWGIHGPSQWHPLSWWSHQLDSELYGADEKTGAAHGHHLTGLLLHTAAAIALFLALQRLTGYPWPSAATAALFAVHPLGVESVAWVAERRDVLCGLFFALTLWAYAAYAQRGGLLRYGLVLLLFTLGLMSKPMLITLPCVMLLLDYWPLKRFTWLGGWLATTSDLPTPPCPRRATLWLIVEKLPLLALAGVAAYLSYRCQAVEGAIIPLDTSPLENRIANALLSYAVYLRHMAWPVGLSPMYPLKHEFPWQTLLPAVLVLLSITGVAIWQARRRPYLIVGWLWYLGMLVPVIGILQMGVDVAMADRWVYLPLIGIYLALALSVWQLVERSWQGQLAAAAAMVFILSVCVAMTNRQANFWRDSETLHLRAIAMDNEATEAHNNLGYVYNDEKQYLKAVDEFNEVLRYKPYHARAHNNIGATLHLLGRDDEAINHYIRALKTDASYPEAYHNLGNALDSKGQKELAIQCYFRAVTLKPGYTDARNNLAALLAEKGQYADALFQLEEGLRYAPGDPKLLDNIRIAKIMLQKRD